MSTSTSSILKFFFSLVAFIAFFVWGMFAFFGWLMPKPADNAVPVNVLERSLGQVVEVKKCQNGRSNLRCDVYFDTGYKYRLDLTDFPKEYLEKGDKIVYKKKVWEESFNNYKCQNGFCRKQSVCYSWMSCWDHRNSPY